jgi:hypothetical protein
VTPDTQVPTITERDVKILAWLFDPEQERPDFSIEDRDETLQRTLAVMRSLSGRSVVVDTETHVAVSKDVLRKLLADIEDTADYEHYGIVREALGWLTPQPEETR